MADVNQFTDPSEANSLNEFKQISRSTAVRRFLVALRVLKIPDAPDGSLVLSVSEARDAVGD